jgi:hypothetical protein
MYVTFARLSSGASPEYAVPGPLYFARQGRDLVAPSFEEISEWFMRVTEMMRASLCLGTPAEAEWVARIIKTRVGENQPVKLFRQACDNVRTILHGEEPWSQASPPHARPTEQPEDGDETEEPVETDLEEEVSDSDEFVPTPTPSGPTPPSEYELAIYEGMQGPGLRLRAGGLNVRLKTPGPLVKGVSKETKKFGWIEEDTLLSFEVVGVDVVWQMISSVGTVEVRTRYGPAFENLLDDISSVKLI